MESKDSGLFDRRLKKRSGSVFTLGRVKLLKTTNKSLKQNFLGIAESLVLCLWTKHSLSMVLVVCEKSAVQTRGRIILAPYYSTIQTNTINKTTKILNLTTLAAMRVARSPLRSRPRSSIIISRL